MGKNKKRWTSEKRDLIRKIESYQRIYEKTGGAIFKVKLDQFKNELARME